MKAMLSFVRSRATPFLAGSAVGLLITLFSFKSPVSMDAQLQKMLDEAEVKRVVNAVFTTADRREWEACAALYTPEIIVDYQSLAGQPAESLSPAQLMARWKGVLPGFQATQHMLSNHEVTFANPNQAVCHFYGHAVHYLPQTPDGEEWGVYGTYRMELIRRKEGWKVRYLQYNHKYQYGNPELPKLAMGRVQARVNADE